MIFCIEKNCTFVKNFKNYINMGKEIKIQMIGLNELKPYKNNPRNNDNAVDYVAKSIEEFGFKVPIIIDKNNVIVAGHTRYKACKKLGIDQVPCIIADDLSEEQVKAFRLADNKVSDYSIWDNVALLKELEELKEFDIFTGFSESDLFGEELNEKDNDFINEIIDDLGSDNLMIKYKCRTLEQFDEIMSFIESIRSKYE